MYICHGRWVSWGFVSLNRKAYYGRTRAIPPPTTLPPGYQPPFIILVWPAISLDSIQKPMLLTQSGAGRQAGAVGECTGCLSWALKLFRQLFRAGKLHADWAMHCPVCRWECCRRPPRERGVASCRAKVTLQLYGIV